MTTRKLALVIYEDLSWVTPSALGNWSWSIVSALLDQAIKQFNVRTAAAAPRPSAPTVFDNPRAYAATRPKDTLTVRSSSLDQLARQHPWCWTRKSSSRIGLSLSPAWPSTRHRGALAGSHARLLA